MALLFRLRVVRRAFAPRGEGFCRFSECSEGGAFPKKSARLVWPRRPSDVEVFRIAERGLEVLERLTFGAAIHALDAALDMPYRTNSRRSSWPPGA